MRKLRLSTPIRVLLWPIKGLAVVFLMLLALVWSIDGNPFDSDPFDDLAFNRRDWLEDADCSDGGNRRGHMADDLLSRHLKRGTTRTQITDLLGEPKIYTQADITKSEGFDPDERQAPMILEYYLGEELSSAGIDTAWLRLRFDEAGRYSGYRIATPALFHDHVAGPAKAGWETLEKG